MARKQSINSRYTYRQLRLRRYSSLNWFDNSTNMLIVVFISIKLKMFWRTWYVCLDGALYLHGVWHSWSSLLTTVNYDTRLKYLCLNIFSLLFWIKAVIILVRWNFKMHWSINKILKYFIHLHSNKNILKTVN